MANEDMLKEEWVDKYRPKTLDEYVIDDRIRQHFKRMVASKNLVSFSVCGCPGSGKTTLARAICNELNAEVLFVKCATEGTIDVLRTKVEPFCNAMSFDGRPKVVILDEVDSATSAAGSGSSFQMGLRTLIEASQSDTRFILTANIENRIIPAVLSRCPLIELQYSQKDLVVHLKKILDSENVSYTKDALKSFIESTFHFYPDCRKIIKHLQCCCANGTLEVAESTICDTDKTDFISTIAASALSSKSLLEVRKEYLQGKSKLIDFVEGATLLFNYAVDNDLVTIEGILKLADMTYQANVVLDKEPIFFGMIAAIKHYAKNHTV